MQTNPNESSALARETHGESVPRICSRDIREGDVSVVPANVNALLYIHQSILVVGLSASSRPKYPRPSPNFPYDFPCEGRGSSKD
jgi:hypothetical protein